MSINQSSDVVNQNRISVILDQEQKPFIVAQGEGWLIILNSNGGVGCYTVKN